MPKIEEMWSGVLIKQNVIKQNVKFYNFINNNRINQIIESIKNNRINQNII